MEILPGKESRDGVGDYLIKYWVPPDSSQFSVQASCYGYGVRCWAVSVRYVVAILGGGGSTSPLVVDALCCGKFLAFAPFAPAAETDIIVKKNYSIVSIGFLLSAINVKIKMLYYRVCLAIRRC